MIRKTLASAALAALVAAPVALGATSASASCHSRKTTGTIVGGVGGALIGNSISHGGGGAVLGGLGGAVLGHEIAKGGCHPTRRAYHRTRHTHYAATPRSEHRAPTRVYYDERGNPVTVSNTDYR
jgi:hypothetical protein